MQTLSSRHRPPRPRRPATSRRTPRSRSRKRRRKRAAYDPAERQQRHLPHRRLQADVQPRDELIERRRNVHGLRSSRTHYRQMGLGTGRFGLEESVSSRRSAVHHAGRRMVAARMFMMPFLAPHYGVWVLAFTIPAMGDGAQDADRLRKLQALTDAALAHLELDALLPTLLLRTREILGVDTCAVLLLDEETDELVARAAVASRAASQRTGVR